MLTENHRVISLIPSATEIVAALGGELFLVGRSHECDYPETVKQLPICTAPNFNPQGNSQAIHERVTELLEKALSIYRVDLEQLKQLNPTHIITQAQCEVCAVSLGDVQAAVNQLTETAPEIISLQPRTLADVYQDIQTVAQALHLDPKPVLDDIETRLTIVNLESRTPDLFQTQTNTNPLKVACIEWTDPLMAAGNWVPELVELAGGQNLLGQVGEHSPWLDFQELVKHQPDVIIFMPCGFNLFQTQIAVQELLSQPAWVNLLAREHPKLYAVDGNQYFNRPGPRLVDSAEIIGEILHAARSPEGKLNQGKFASQGAWATIPTEADRVTQAIVQG
ncbi:cobalamin-binding protein [Synechococcus sp. PCC 6312]|uniref:cobalamin-binding protein n=1 Tax=Synechococcus sp. (strain ATCC 27167 / PCC 6312) TaxID=195253 RepID=UPI00029EDEB2|nr:cobalamin-binding protein [Synechococcus sp. PCC 6312]AFY60617.1 ABC-type Fe3+-hydroxamate transport system, periplasmic component [Synechococcus sp. PCC 6312]